MYYREARKLRGAGRRRGKSGAVIVVLAMLVALVAYLWAF